MRFHVILTHQLLLKLIHRILCTSLTDFFAMRSRRIQRRALGQSLASVCCCNVSLLGLLPDNHPVLSGLSHILEYLQVATVPFASIENRHLPF